MLHRCGMLMLDVVRSCVRQKLRDAQIVLRGNYAPEANPRLPVSVMALKSDGEVAVAVLACTLAAGRAPPSSAGVRRRLLEQDVKSLAIAISMPIPLRLITS